MDSNQSSKSYRPDIDGLRAVAVLAVIAFHIDKRLLPGGFVGVDVFFVISGFLISLNIAGDIERGKFNLVDFYSRRIKRIAPPMMLVVLVTLLAAQLVMLPGDAANTAKSAAWSVLSLANVYFWRSQDVSYFAAASNEIPLLHLWSLGVEEQFYLAWPLLLMWLYRRERSRSVMVGSAVVAVLSFAFAEGWFSRDPSFSYYMLPTRAGEFLLGALVAFAVLRGVKHRISLGIAEWMAGVGALLLLLTLFALDESSVFPGLLAIPPTVGTALMILAGHCQPTLVSRGLSVKPVVWIGLLSYSAYLWHWPLLAFLRYGHPEFGAIAGILALVATFALAWVTYRFLEQPARHCKAPARRIFTLQFLAPTLAIGALTVLAVRLDGYGPRWWDKGYRQDLAALRDRTKPAYQFEDVCQRQRLTGADTENARCIHGSPTDGRTRVLLLGDSNAAHYIGVVGTFAREAGFSVRNLAIGSCPPIAADPAPYVAANRLSDCRASIGPMQAAMGKADALIISASWTSYVERAPQFLADFEAVLAAAVIADKPVLIIGKAPVVDGYDRRCAEKMLSYPGLTCPALMTAPRANVVHLNRQLRDLAGRFSNVAYYDIGEHLCRNQLCSAFGDDGQSLYFDSAHLSFAGSWLIGERIFRRDGVPAEFLAIARWLREHPAP